MDTKEDLVGKLKSKKARVAILGLGYVGLPLAVVFAEAGFNVTGIDPDGRKSIQSTTASAISRTYPRNVSPRWFTPEN